MQVLRSQCAPGRVKGQRPCWAGLAAAAAAAALAGVHHKGPVDLQQLQQAEGLAVLESRGGRAGSVSLLQLEEHEGVRRAAGAEQEWVGETCGLRG